MDNPIWLMVVGYEMFYEVSEFGEVRRSFRRGRFPSGGLLKHAIERNGYHFVRLSVEGKVKTHFVHRLVAAAFLGVCPEWHEVNHKDMDKSNNHYSNLEYVTHKRNIEHSWESGERRFTVPRGESQGLSKLTNADIVDIRRLSSEGVSQRKLAARFGVSHVAIGHILRGTTWTHIP